MNSQQNAEPLEVDCGTVQQKLEGGEDFLLLDCREPDEHELVHLHEAVLLPMSQLQARVNELTEHADREIVIHCHHGGRSLQVARWLRSRGYPRAKSMAGGIDAWALEIDSTLPRY